MKEERQKIMGTRKIIQIGDPDTKACYYKLAEPNQVLVFVERWDLTKQAFCPYNEIQATAKRLELDVKTENSKKNLFGKFKKPSKLVRKYYE